ncbi:MAG TPA: dihydrolipoyl dehydrogenase [Kiloniellales bacterium]|nr:dihydrolipoyl dehydrogenase [Kiloniellales bacterium]
MTDGSYDVVVIGGGPGGYVCAIRAAQLGLRTACVEMRGALGGTCLNVGCIPSKALLHASEKFAEAKHGLERFGVKLDKVELDLAALMAQKDKTVTGLTQGIAFLFKKHKIDYLEGRGTIAAPGRVTVSNASGERREIETEAIVIATGSDHMTLPGIEIDERRIVSSTGALSLETVPRRMVVVGGGYIGLEMGSVWSRLGAEVTVVEFLDRILAGMDAELGKTMHRILRRQGLSFKLSTKVTKAEPGDGVVNLTLEPAEGGDAESLEADVVMVAIGRKPYTEGLGLDEVGVERDKAGRIQVDPGFKTNVEGIYAIGDVIAGPMLAHKAEEEGVALAEILAGQSGHVNYETVPGIVYTWPEVASVGKTEEQLKDSGVDYRAGKFAFQANSRARCGDDTDGFVKILADARSDRILGGHIVGPDAGTLIHEIVVAMEFGGSAEDLARSFHGHPTLNEAVKEAALAVAGRAIHA